MSPSEALNQYVFFHNRGVETANFGPLLALFAAEAILDFQDPPIGTFCGLSEIDEIFQRNPPVFMLGIGRIRESGQTAAADYFDRHNSGVRLGSIKLETNGDKITRISIGK